MRKYTAALKRTMQKEIDRLQYLLTIIPPLLRVLDKEEFERKPSADIWSPKEIIGHLIDEATNNHQTLVRSQLEQESQQFYDLHYWNRFGFYNRMSQQEVILLWETYNRQLLQSIKSIPGEYLNRECNTVAGRLSMRFLVRNYLQDMELHLGMVVSYQAGQITQ